MPKKPAASSETVMEFVRLIWPDFTEAAMALFTEQALLQDAIDMLRAMRAVEAAAQDHVAVCRCWDPSPVRIALAALDTTRGEAFSTVVSPKAES